MSLKKKDRRPSLFYLDFCWIFIWVYIDFTCKEWPLPS